MALEVSIDWGSSIINVTRSGLALIQSVPTEIRQMDINEFRLNLKDLEDSLPGMGYLKTHDHNTEVTVGGVTLARVIEILDPYTITFEDGRYAVNLFGANSNVGDKVNVNQVSVRSANSAGLVTSQAIEYGEYGGGVTIDEINGSTGTVYPKGTPRDPINNISDAAIISNSRGFSKLFIIGDLTLNNGDDVSNLVLYGQGATNSNSKTSVYLNNGVITANTEYNNAFISGIVNGESRYTRCVIGPMENAHCVYEQCALAGPMSLHNLAWTANHTSVYYNCFTFENWFELDYNNSYLDQVYTNFTGRIKFSNITRPESHIILQMDAGEVHIDSTCTDGTVILKGNGTYKDDSGGSVNIINSGLLNVDHQTEHVWNANIADYLVSGTLGRKIYDIPDEQTFTI